MRFKLIVIFLLLTLVFLFPASAAEYSDGAIRLVLDGDSGRFSLFSVQHQNDRRRPLALFYDRDPRTSFLSVMVNDRQYIMGNSSAFRLRLGTDPRTPSLIFESSFMTVTKEFTFVQSPNSTQTNGVYVMITLENRGERPISAGARFLLDTHLGEETGALSFSSNRRNIGSELILERAHGDSVWTDRNDRVSLTGSLFNGLPTDPDSIHFANWKKLNDVSWRAHYQPGRNFNLPPFSIRDMALCYYFDVRPLGPGERRSFGFSLVLNDDAGVVSFLPSGQINLPDIMALPDLSNLPPLFDLPSPEQMQQDDLLALIELIDRIDRLITSGTATEDELAEIELSLSSLREKYSQDNTAR